MRDLEVYRKYYFKSMWGIQCLKAYNETHVRSEILQIQGYLPQDTRSRGVPVKQVHVSLDIPGSFIRGEYFCDEQPKSYSLLEAEVHTLLHGSLEERAALLKKKGGAHE